MKNNSKLLFLSAIACCLSFVAMSCGSERNIADEQGVEIASVIDGNTVELANGLKVHLLGVSPNSTMTENHLKGLVGKTISLTPDSQGNQTFVSYDDESGIWAYATLDETGEPLNRELLKLGGKNAFDTDYLNDSLVSYQKIVEHRVVELTNEQLAERVCGASFLIFGQDSGGETFVGTGFFISNDGLALSCSHVINYDGSYIIRLSTPDGKIIDKPYDIKRPLFCGDYSGKEDYAIFYVDLDDNAKRSLHPLSLAQKTPPNASLLVTAGNPAPQGVLLSMSTAIGSISNKRDEYGRIQADIKIGPGFSGGAEIDKYGEVVGINQSLLIDETTGTPYTLLTDINMVREKLDELNEPYNGK